MRKQPLFFILFLFIHSNNFCQSWKKQYGGYLKTDKENLPIEMKIEKNSDSITGSYYYNNIGNDMRLAGILSGTKIMLNEYNTKGKLTGTFTGTYYIKGDSIKGNWTNASRKTSLPFTLKAESITDYKIVTRKVSYPYPKSMDIDGEFQYAEWLEMKNNPDTLVQNYFNSLDDNTKPDVPGDDPEIYYYKDGDEKIYFGYNKTTWVETKNDWLISFGTFHSDYVGGMGGNNVIDFTNIDLKNRKQIILSSLLRTDTSSLKILHGWIELAIKNRGDWNYWVDDYGADYLNSKYVFYNMYLKEDGVYFFFPRPGAVSNILGLQDVRISYRNFIKIIDKNSVVYEWIIQTGKAK